MKTTTNSLAASAPTFSGTASTIPGAPPKIDGDWKHWLFDLANAAGIPSELIWILGGLAAFFIGRVMLASITKDLRGQLESLKSLVQIDAVLSNTRLPYISWARLAPKIDSPDLLRSTGDLLAVGAGLARLYRHQRVWQSTGFGMIVSLAALVTWAFGNLINPFGLWFNVICIGVAWCPCGLLILIWWRNGDLQRMKDRSEIELKALQDRY